MNAQIGEYRHRIGDALYELWDGDWDGNGFPDEVHVWPVVKITERFVYIRSPKAYDTKTYRLDRAELERTGEGFHRAALSILYVRPQLDWPMAVISVSTPEQRAIEGVA